MGGHRIFACPSKGGARVPAVVIHSRWDDYIKDSVATGSAVGVELRLPILGHVFIVCAHLSATSSRSDFSQTLEDLETIFQAMPNDASVMCGVDANCNLAGVDSSRALVGPFTGDILPGDAAEQWETAPDWKAIRLMRILFEYRLQACNTHFLGAHGQITHFCENGESRQIDYFLGRGLHLQRVRLEKNSTGC